MGLEILVVPFLLLMWAWFLLPLLVGALAFWSFKARTRPVRDRVRASTVATVVSFVLLDVVPLTIIAAGQPNFSPGVVIAVLALPSLGLFIVWAGLLWFMATWPGVRKSP